MRRVGTLVASVVVLGGVLVWASEPAFAAGPVVDNRVGDFGSILKGKGVYNETGKQQRVTLAASHGQFRQFEWQLKNKGDSGTVTLDGKAGAGCFAVKYFNEVASDITDFVVMGGSDGITAGAKLPLTIQIKAKGCAVPGQTFTTHVDVSPTKAPNDFDRVKAKLKVV